MSQTSTVPSLFSPKYQPKVHSENAAIASQWSHFDGMSLIHYNIFGKK